MAGQATHLPAPQGFVFHAPPVLDVPPTAASPKPEPASLAPLAPLLFLDGALEELQPKVVRQPQSSNTDSSIRMTQGFLTTASGSTSSSTAEANCYPGGSMCNPYNSSWKTKMAVASMKKISIFRD